MANIAAEAEREKLQEDIQRIQLALQGQGDDDDDDYYDDDGDDSDVLQIDIDRDEDSRGADDLPSTSLQNHAQVLSDTVELQPEFLDDLVQLDSEELPVSVETALALNRAYQEIVCETLKKIELTLAENRERQAGVQLELDGKAAGRDKEPGTSVRRKPLAQYAIPYLKDVNGNFPPKNTDVTTKKQLREHKQDVKPSSYWTSAQRKTLIEAVKQDTLEKMLRPFMNRKEIECDKLLGCKSNKDAEIHRRIKEIDKEIDEKTNISSDELFTCVNSEAVDWLKISAMTFNGKRDPMACQMMWQNVLDPSVNRDHWGEEEQDALIELVDKYDMKDWTAVAKELGTNRTPFQCLQYFQRHVNNIAVKRDWTEEEDELLAEVVESCRSGTRIPWNQVAYYIEDRDPMQCTIRWNQIDPNIKRGKWSTAEDCALVSAVELMGMSDWFRIQEYVPNRTAHQCRERYMNCLDPTLKPMVWSYEEDKELLMRMQLQGTAWAKIASEMPGRTDNMCLQRYRRLMDWQRKTELIEKQPSHVKEELLGDEYKLFLGESNSPETPVVAPHKLKRESKKKQKEKLVKSNDNVTWRLLQHQFGIEKDDYLKRNRDRETGDIVVPRPPLLRKYTVRSLSKVWHKREQMQKIIEAQIQRSVRNNLNVSQVAENAEMSMASLSDTDMYQGKAAGGKLGGTNLPKMSVLSDLGHEIAKGVKLNTGNRPFHQLTVRQILDLGRKIAGGVKFGTDSKKTRKRRRKVLAPHILDRSIRKVLRKKMTIIPKKKKKKGRPRRFDIFAAPDTDEEEEDSDAERKVKLTTVELLMKALDIDQRKALENASKEVSIATETNVLSVSDPTPVQKSKNGRQNPVNTVAEIPVDDSLMCNSTESDFRLLKTITNWHLSDGLRTAPKATEDKSKSVAPEPVSMVSMGSQTEYDINPPRIIVPRKYQEVSKTHKLPLLPPNVTNLHAFRTVLLHRKHMIDNAGKKYNLKFYKSRFKRNKVKSEGDETSGFQVHQQCHTKVERYKQELESALHNVHQEVDRTESKGKKKSESSLQKLDTLSEIRKTDDFQLLRNRLHSLFAWPALLSTIYPPVPTETAQHEQSTVTSGGTSDQAAPENQTPISHKARKKKRGRYPCAHNKKFYQQSIRTNEWKEDINQKRQVSKQNKDGTEVTENGEVKRGRGRPCGSRTTRIKVKEPVRRSSRQSIKPAAPPPEVKCEETLPKLCSKRRRMKARENMELQIKKLRLDTIQPIQDGASVQSIQNSVTSMQPIQNSVTSAQPIQNSVTSVQAIQISVTSMQPIQNSVTSVQPIQNSVTSMQPIQNSVTSVQPMPSSTVSVQPIQDCLVSFQPIQGSVASVLPVENSVPPELLQSVTFGDDSSSKAPIDSPALVAQVAKNGTEQFISLSLQSVLSNSPKGSVENPVIVPVFSSTGDSSSKLSDSTNSQS